MVVHRFQRLLIDHDDMRSNCSKGGTKISGKRVREW